MIFGYPILSIGLSAGRAAIAVRTVRPDFNWNRRSGAVMGYR
jgi:hypothetical protein